MNKIKNNYVDLLPLKAQTLNNSAIYKELILLFIVSIEEYMNVMNNDLKTYNWSALFNVAHKIIPSVRIFGIGDLEPIMLQLETNFKNQDNFESIEKQVKDSLRIFSQVKNELETELKLIEDAST